MRKILLSGIQPSGKLHIGNYFGAIKQFVDLQNSYECYIFVANYHALNTVQDERTLRDNSLEVAIDYLAAGLDPKKVTLFLQSDVPEVTELAWIFESLTPVPYLMRAHAYKDAEARGREMNAGLFNYPMLMAADILIQGAELVPTGQDQKQHIEYARDTAERFNRVYGETFILPEAHILENVAVVPGTDGRKMSKSYKNTIPLFAEKDEIKKLVMSISTDSKAIHEPKNPETDVVFAFHKLVSGEDVVKDLERRYRKGDIGYHESKVILIDTMDKYLAPLRKRRAEVANDVVMVRAVLKKGGQKARTRAIQKMKAVRERVGLS